MEIRTVAGNWQPSTPKEKATTIALQQDCGYHKAQQLLQSMYNANLISLQEFNAVTKLNRQAFAPFLVELLPKISG
ncbi:SHOCT domain-containing protein [Pectinatus cerevisiiphilus]|uniref:SHOCT-like domain-containing protein n=1 Tax=Pectinatus cerevisiiphilus TaxID=86956 RepID=A0A4V2URG0_9FIRM|nr:SHOCT domain-containing protein [Pectinatus cerevisiiphilus]TCS77612.1 hypothetical protein EDC37_11413 [Pectinatus cerevisiiphilus]